MIHSFSVDFPLLHFHGSGNSAITLLHVFVYYCKSKTAQCLYDLLYAITISCGFIDLLELRFQNTLSYP